MFVRALTATRYVQPLREGGSLPAIVDTDSGDLFVAKFRGAGQGVKALIAELIVGLLAREVLPVPELALITIPEAFGRSEPDPEIQDLLRTSHGVNFGMRYLDGAFNFDPAAAGEFISPDLAAQIVWFDAFLSNPDRTHRNPNLLIWNRKPWLIDHGAALYVHHDWRSLNDKTVTAEFANVEAARRRYIDYLTTRLEPPRAFVAEAMDARARAKRVRPMRLAARR